MLGQSCKLRIRAGAGQYLSVARGDHTPAFALERIADDRRPAASSAGGNDLVDEVHKLVWKSHRDLFAHPITVAKWEQGTLLPQASAPGGSKDVRIVATQETIRQTPIPHSPGPLLPIRQASDQSLVAKAQQKSGLPSTR